MTQSRPYHVANHRNAFESIGVIVYPSFKRHPFVARVYDVTGGNVRGLRKLYRTENPRRRTRGENRAMIFYFCFFSQSEQLFEPSGRKTLHEREILSRAREFEVPDGKVLPAREAMF